MNNNRSSLYMVFLGVIVAALFSSCSSTATGTSSLTLFSNRTELNSLYTPVSGAIEERDCFTMVFFYLIWTGSLSNHEALVGRVLEEHKADVLLDAQLYTSVLDLPYLLTRTCVEVQGTPAKIRK